MTSLPSLVSNFLPVSLVCFGLSVLVRFNFAIQMLNYNYLQLKYDELGLCVVSSFQARINIRIIQELNANTLNRECFY